MRQPRSICRRQRELHQQNQDGAPQAPSRVLKRAVSYLERVKRTFAERPEVYRTFLAVMHAFKEQRIDIEGLVAQVYRLFEGHSNLLVGFNTFLPIGHSPLKPVGDDHRHLQNMPEPVLRPAGEQQAVAVGTGF